MYSGVFVDKMMLTSVSNNKDYTYKNSLSCILNICAFYVTPNKKRKKTQSVRKK